MVHVVDTHAIIWFLQQDERLGQEARRVLRDFEARLVIPTIVLAEIKHLAARQRIDLRFDEVIRMLENDSRCTIYPLDGAVIDTMPVQLDIHDGIICGTALLYQRMIGEEVAILTRDEAIRNSGIVETVW